MQNHSNIFLATAKTATGTFVDFDIPAGVKRVTVMFDGVSTNGVSEPLMRLGSSEVVEDMGYKGTTSYASTFGAWTVGVRLIGGATIAAVAQVGALTLSNMVGSSWVIQGSLGRSDAAQLSDVSGLKPSPLH